MNPDDVVLVVLLNNPIDYERMLAEQWYRIPVRHAPKLFSSAQFLAFYLSSAFRDQKWAIHEYAAVRGHELARRRDLLPEEPDHPRADESYYKLQLGPVERRDPPIVSKRGRRILFIWTTWAKFSTARELNDLFVKTPAQDKLWEALKDANLDAEREVIIREGRTRYRVDFLIYSPSGRLGVAIGPRVGRPKGSDFRSMAISEDELENHFERALDQIKAKARGLGEHYTQEAKA